MYLAFRDGSLGALDIESGTLLWYHQFANEFDPDGSDNGTVLVAGPRLLTQFDGELLVLKRDSGQIESVSDLAGRTLAGAAVSSPFVYLFRADASLACSCACWNYRENALHWETPIAGYVDAITLSGSTVLLAPNGDSCLALSADNGQ